MPQKHSQLKAGVLLSYLTLALNILIHLVYTPVMIHLLGPSEHGLYTLVAGVVSNLSLLSLGLSSSYLRFFSRYKNDNDTENIARLNGLFVTVFGIMSLVALTAGLVLARFPRELFGENLTEYEIGRAKILFVILVVNIALSFPDSIFISFISSRERFAFQRAVEFLSILCNPLITLPFLLLGYGSVAVVSVTTVITVIKLIVHVIFCITGLSISFRFDRLDLSLFGEIAAFSFFIFINQLIDQINLTSDKYILGRVAGTAAVSVYGVGSSINHLYQTMSTSVSSVFAPRINRIVARGDEGMQSDLNGLFVRVGRIQYIILSLVCTGFIFFGRYFVTEIYAGASYGDSYWVVLLLIIPSTISLIQNISIEIQRAMNKHQFRSLVYLGMAILNILVSIPLAKRFGPIGAAVGTTFAVILANGIVMNIFYRKALKLDVGGFWLNILKVSRGLPIPVGLGTLMLLFIPYTSKWAFVGLIVAYTAVFCVSMWQFGMNGDEKGLIKKLIRKVFKQKQL